MTLVAATVLAGGGTANAAERTASYERGLQVTVNKARAAAGSAPMSVVRCADSLAESVASRMRRKRRTLRVAPTTVAARCGRPLVLQAVSITRDGARKLARTWLGNPTARRLALGSRARSVGVGAVRDRSGRWYVSLLLVGAAYPPSEDTASTGSLDGSAGTDTGSTTGDSTGGATDSSTGDTAGDSTTGGSTGDSTGDSTTGDGTGGTTGGDSTGETTAALGSAILTETNRRRAQHGLAPLEASPCATDFATEHSRRMAEDGTLAHAALSDLQRTCTAQDAAENVAASSSVDAATLLDMWMASTMHRGNILDPDLTHLGVGVAQDPATGRWYATQDFLALA